MPIDRSTQMWRGRSGTCKRRSRMFIGQKKVLRTVFGNEPTKPDYRLGILLLNKLSLRGINFHTEESPQAIIKSADGSLSLKTNKGTVDGFSHVMFATGRIPNTKNLGLEEVGVKLAKNRAIVVDEYSRTSVDSISAVGDVTDRLNLTPVALMEDSAFAKTVFGNEPTKPDYRCICKTLGFRVFFILGVKNYVNVHSMFTLQIHRHICKTLGLSVSFMLSCLE